MDSNKKLKTKNEVLSYIMELVKSDPLIPDNAKFKVRYYMSITYDAAFEIVTHDLVWAKHTHKIRAISPSGHELGIWPEVQLAAEAMKVTRQSIGACLRHGRPMVRGRLNGIRWEYVKKD